MRPQSWKFSTALALGVLIAGFISGELSARIRGRLVAHADLARGHYEILSFGLPLCWRPDYTPRLRECYGIKERVVAGGVVSVPLVEYVDGYNEVSMDAANRKLGRDVFRETVADAVKNWQTKRRRRSARTNVDYLRSHKGFALESLGASSR
jgi:hypothetical protein